MGEDPRQWAGTSQAETKKLEAWLGSLSKDELLAELFGLLDRDPELRRRFELRSASVNADAAAIRSAVWELMELPRTGYLEYDEAFEYANNVLRAAGAIDDLVGAGGAADAVGLAREAIGLLTRAYGSIDDSSGAVGDAACQLLAVHLRACEAAPPEPVSLGAYLAGLLLNNDCGFEPDLGDYTELLGGAGAETLRARIAGYYASNPASWHAMRLMESVLRAGGDVDAIVAFYAANLDDRGWRHLRIAEELTRAGRPAQALAWAERGVREAGRPDERLVEFVAGRYEAEGRHDDVLALRRARFAAERTLAHYQMLCQAAAHSGGWPAERAEALRLLTEDARDPATPASWGWHGPVLIDVLVDEGDLDTAWSVADGIATADQLLGLARASLAARPADALAVYLRAIERLKNQTGDVVYRQMTSHLLAARACHQALGTDEEFRRYLADLRMDQKRKRNLMKILDQNGLFIRPQARAG